MEKINIIFQIFASLVLVCIAIYGALYFTQITKIERQLGLRIPRIVKKILGILMMIPMMMSIVLLIIILAEIYIY